MAESSPSKNLSTSSRGVSVSRPANPRLRNSESTDPKRRSFVGSQFPRPSINTGQRGSAGGCGPNTPANSPSDYYCPRRSSIGKENVSMASRDNHKRENNAEQIRKPGEVESPAATVKGCQKHFMSPTISAASRAIAVSSRKKVLVDKDERIRTSISFSGGKLPCMEGSDKELNQKKEVSLDANVTYLGEDKEEAVQSEDDLEEKDPRFKISARPGDSSSLPTSLASGDVMPPLSPLDADPHMVPYDPKTNYLSPRPRFLHYKHNPRVELYFHKGRSGDLTDRFSAESLSNAEVTEDEVASDDGPYKKEEEEEEEEEDMEVLEADHSSASEADTVDAQVKKTVKRHVVTRAKVIPILFILASVGLYLSVYSLTVMEPSVFNNLNLPELYVPTQLSNFARDNFEQVTQRIQPLLHHYISYLHKLILGFSQRHDMVALEYANLTCLLEDSLVDEASVVFFSESALEHVNLVSGVKGDVIHKESEKHPEEIEKMLGLDLSVDHHTSSEAEETNMAELVDKSSLEAAKVGEGQQDNSEHLVPDTFTQPEGFSGDSLATLGVPEANMDTMAGTSELQSIIDHEERTGVPQEGTIDAREPESAIDTEIQDQPITKTVEMASSTDAVAVLAVMAGLLVAIALFYRGTRRALPTTDAALASHKATQMIEEEKAIEQNSEQPILSSNLLTEVEYTGDDTCASAMSGSQPAAASHRKELNARGTTSQEAWSQERRGQRNYSRRESSASSGGGHSMESKSYGSFTTYEKFPAKHHKVRGEEEAAVITPVRRSSRLRSKVGSPAPEQAT